nr:venom protein [Lampona murina]
MWKISLLLAILGALEIASSAEYECPPSEDISPCECGTTHQNIGVHLTCKDELGINLDTFTSILKHLSGKKITSLKISNLKIDTLPSNLFANVNVQHLWIRQAKFDSLTDGDRPFLGLENTLEDLRIEASRIGGKIKLGHMKRLKSLKLIESDLPELNGYLFEDGVPSLERLVIKSNHPSTISKNAFANLTNLKQVFIGSQTFEKFERSLFPNPAPKLRDIDIDSAQISYVPKDVFSNMPELDTIILRRNEISRVDESIWSSIWDQLDFLDLDGNPIICDSRLNWLLSRKNIFFFARCAYPEEFKGRRVGHFPYNKKQYDR